MDGLFRRLGSVLILLAAAMAGAVAMALLIGSSSAASAGTIRGAAGLAFLVLIAVVFALRLIDRRVNRVRADLDTLSQAMDKAVRELAARSNRDVTTMAQLQEKIARDLDAFRSASPTRAVSANPPAGEREPDADAGNVVPYPQSRLGRKARDARPRPAETSVDITPLVRQALATRSLDLSLRPIISMARGAAAGFDVFAHFDTDGDGIDLPASALDIEDSQRAAYESLLVEEAIGTARRRLGSVSQAMPLHISVSAAFLADAASVGRLVAAARAHEPLAGALVLCVPAVLARRDDPAFAPLQRIAETGLRIAIEDWAPNAEIALPATLQVAFLKVNSRRLIEEAGGTELPARALAAGALVVAVDVTADEEAMALIDEGVNLMSGPRFSGPRRLRPDDEGAIERMSRISV